MIKYPLSSNISTVATRRRIQDNGYIYWIYSSSRTSQTVHLEGEGYPLRLNLWTGEVSPIAAFNSSEGYTAINITIGENGAEAIYLGHRNPYGIKNLERHIISTDGEGIVDESGSVFLRATKNGKYTAKLSTGNSTTVTFQSIRPPVMPRTWTLTVEDWSPIDNETGLDSSLTEKATLPPVTLAQLKSWHNISGLEYASGVGVYQTNVDLSIHQPDKGQQSLGVYFNIGNVQGSWGLEVNGQIVPGADFFTSRPVDVTSYIRNGANGKDIATPQSRILTSFRRQDHRGHDALEQAAQDMAKPLWGAGAGGNRTAGASEFYVLCAAACYLACQDVINCRRIQVIVEEAQALIQTRPR